MNATQKVNPVNLVLKNAEWWDHSNAAKVDEKKKEQWIKELIESAKNEPDETMWYITSGDTLILVQRTEAGNFDVMELQPRRSAYLELDACICDATTLFQFGCRCGNP